MERRTFLRTGLATLGVAGVGGVGTLEALERRFPATDRRGWRLDRMAPGSAAMDGALRLDSNENPLGLSPAGRRAIIDGLGEANRYPRESRQALIEALARKHGVEKENLVLGSGSTEVLQMAVQALGGPDARLVVADPTFEDVGSYADPLAYHLIEVPLNESFQHDLDRMRDSLKGSSSPALVYICNPNNPTGTVTPCAEVDAWIESAPAHVTFLIDEAYFEYVDDPGYWTSIPWTRKRPNVVIARTFSKIYGMAGMRLGYAIAREETAARIRRFRSKNNANQLALVAALASLGDSDLEARSLRANRDGMRKLTDCLDRLGLERIPSQTNFLMHRVPGDLKQYIGRMKEHGARVGRPFPPMLEYNRVSIGLPEEMERFCGILHEFRERGWI
ncbi:MAG: pyridoxal phosphate-dependent aminotransferase [Gemmatimonadota bacterium]